ncbi:MAG: hypothetical protein AAFP18_14860 [Bacteroidota bacterium]
MLTFDAVFDVGEFFLTLAFLPLFFLFGPISILIGWCGLRSYRAHADYPDKRTSWTIGLTAALLPSTVLVGFFFLWLGQLFFSTLS